MVNGFSSGFHIPFVGERKFRSCSNLTSVNHRVDILQDKIDKEVSAGRVGGPFDTLPMPNLQISPLGLVPKKEINEFRIIHHLSFPAGKSINDGIAPEFCSVRYQTIDDATKHLLACGKGALLAKTDIEHAYKLVPIHPEDYELLGFSIDNKYYFDRTLPMGLSCSCQLFEKFSSALHWILQSKLGVQGCVHILDDFLFVGPPGSSACKRSLMSFYELSASLGVPIKEDKTVHPTTTITFLGLELDSVLMEIRLPLDKLVKIRTQLLSMTKCKKVSLVQLQSLIGLLNFACLAVVPGRTFLRRIIDLTIGLRKPHHVKRLNVSARADIAAWLVFIESFNGRALLLPTLSETSRSLNMYTDASNVGIGGCLGSSWYSCDYSAQWLKYHITVREFFAIIVALEIWGETLSNKRIQFFTDNMAVVHIINSNTSKDPSSMKLMRRFMINVLKYNIVFQATHIPGLSNVAADQLSRLQIDEFHKQFPGMDKEGVRVPPHVMTL